MKANGVAAALQNYTFKVIVKEISGAATPLREGLHVTTQEVLQRLVKEKLQGQRARIRQRQQQTGEPPGGASDLHCPKGSPVNLPLFADKGAQPQESFPRPGTQGGHQAAQRHYAACVTAGADHLVNAGGAKSRVLLESLADELDIGIGQPGPHDLVPIALGLQSPLHRLVVQAQLIGYGSDLPVLGKKESADVGLQFGVDHALPPSGRGRQSDRRDRNEYKSVGNRAGNPKKYLHVCSPDASGRNFSAWSRPPEAPTA